MRGAELHKARSQGGVRVTGGHIRSKSVVSFSVVFAGQHGLTALDLGAQPDQHVRRVGVSRSPDANDLQGRFVALELEHGHLSHHLRIVEDLCPMQLIYGAEQPDELQNPEKREHATFEHVLV